LVSASITAPFACAPECGWTLANCQRFDLVDKFATAVIALAGITFRVLVGQHRALRLQHGLRNNILGGNQLDLRLLALQFFKNGAAYRRIARGKRFFEERGGWAV
jgi:hypothetical protein